MQGQQAERTGANSGVCAQTGTARVRGLLFEPLEAAGMQRPAGMTVADYEAMRGRLCRALSHMSDRSLRGLAELVTRHAQGRSADRWPKEVSVRSWAFKIQPPPARRSDYVASLMVSVMGRTAREQGYHVELFMLARKLGPPPSRYDLGKLRDEAQENRRMVEIVRRQIDSGSASRDSRQWLDWFRNNEAECLAVMDAAGDDRETGE